MSAATPRKGSLGGDIAVVLGWYVVAGLLGGLVWRLVVDLPRAVRVAQGVALEPDQVVKQVDADAWFVVIAVVLGGLSGVALAWWRRRDPLVLVALLVLGGGVAALLMLLLGGFLGPSDPTAGLGRAAVGASASTPLRVHALGAPWVWPAASALGAFACLWIFTDPDQKRADREAATRSDSPDAATTMG